MSKFRRPIDRDVSFGPPTITKIVEGEHDDVTFRAHTPVSYHCRMVPYESWTVDIDKVQADLEKKTAVTESEVSKGGGGNNIGHGKAILGSISSFLGENLLEIGGLAAELHPVAKVSPLPLVLQYSSSLSLCRWLSRCFRYTK